MGLNLSLRVLIVTEPHVGEQIQRVLSQLGKNQFVFEESSYRGMEVLKGDDSFDLIIVDEFKGFYKKISVHFSGAGLKDFSRIASSSPEMWTDIFLENHHHLLPAINQFRQLLDRMQDAIQHEDREELAALLRQAKDSRDQWVLQ